MIAAGNRKIVRAVGKSQLGGDLGCAGRQLERAGARKRERNQKSEDQALFYLAWRSNFAARAFRRCAI